ncbi:MAG: type II secretion system F family protein [Blastocatellales bacterium]
MTAFFVFLFCLFATYAVYLVATRKAVEERARMRQRISEVLAYSAGVDEEELRLAREELLSEIPLMHKLLIRLRSVTQIKRMIDQADLQLTVMRLFMFSALAGLLAMLAVSAISVNLLLILASAAGAAVIPFLHVLYKRQQRFHKFLTDLPEALDLMARALAAGHAFTEAMNLVASEMPEPISKEFRQTYEEQNLGLSFKLALRNLSERMPLMDLHLCVTAILIQRETGGNLSEILEKVSQTIRERFRILEDLKTLTTQSRISAWVLCGVPIFITIAASVMNPDYMSILWDDPRGHKLIALASGMQIAGMLMIRKILQIKI